MDNKHTNLEYLRSVCNGDHQMIGQIVQMFKEGTSQLLIMIGQNLLEDKLDDLKRNAHKAKSSFRMLGASSTADKLEQIETGVEVMSKDDIQSLLNKINEETYCILLELENLNTTDYEL